MCVVCDCEGIFEDAIEDGDLRGTLALLRSAIDKYLRVDVSPQAARCEGCGGIEGACDAATHLGEQFAEVYGLLHELS
jgi:hypothetical protein